MVQPGIKSEYASSGQPPLEGVFKMPDGRSAIKASQLRQLHQQLDRLSMLMDVSRSMSMAEIDLDALLILIMQSVTTVMGADRSSLFLVDRENAQLRSRVAQGAPEIRVPINEGIAGHTATTGETANIRDAYSDPRFNREIDSKMGYQTKNILCMPILNPRSEIIGVVEVLNRLDGSPFSEDDEELLGAFAGLAGISLENARAYEEIQRSRSQLEVRIHERTADLEEAKKQSDDLLLNILPAGIAEELKQHGHATPRRYDLVTVLFADIRDFTRSTEHLAPEALIQELDRYFAHFDELAERYNLEKIKTIGDAYMCAGGIPRPNRTNPIDAVLAALEMRRFIEEMKRDKMAQGKDFWELRIGIHSGPVVAGIVGKKKFAYDIWGDAVNTASRMESSGEPGMINVSGVTYQLIQEFFVTSYRGRVEAKNKGEVDMYFVTGIRPELSINGAGIEPNDRFHELLNRPDFGFFTGGPQH